MNTYDIIVLGAGPGGYAAALEGARLGKAVALVEPNLLGGTCLNWGCIPTKLFLGATAAGPALEASAKLKMASGDVSFDLPALQKRREKVVGATRKAMEKRLADADVKLIRGTGRLVGPDTLAVEADGEGDSLRFGACIAATGSRPKSFPGMEPDGDCVLDSTQALALTEPPESLIVVGAGAIGLEMADFYSRLGGSITIVEALDRVAPTEDPDISAALAQVYKRRKWKVLTGAKVAGLTTEGGQARLVLESGEELTAAKALVAVGRLPNSAGLGLEDAGGTLTNGWAAVDDCLRAAAGIYAIGDLNGQWLLAHAAEHQGHFAARHAAGAATGPYVPGPMPGCIYGSCEVMRAGMTEAEAADTGLETFSTKAMLAANPIAQAAGATHGLVKVLWKKTDPPRVVGVSAVGHGVSHLVTQGTIMVKEGWTPAQAESLIFAHPTLDESLRDALLAEPAG